VRFSFSEDCSEIISGYQKHTAIKWRNSDNSEKNVHLICRGVDVRWFNDSARVDVF